MVKCRLQVRRYEPPMNRWRFVKHRFINVPITFPSVAAAQRHAQKHANEAQEYRVVKIDKIPLDSPKRFG